MTDEEFNIIREFDYLCEEFVMTNSQFFQRIYGTGNEKMAELDLSTILTYIIGKMPITQGLFEYDVDPKMQNIFKRQP